MESEIEVAMRRTELSDSTISFRRLSNEYKKRQEDKECVTFTCALILTIIFTFCIIYFFNE